MNILDYLDWRGDLSFLQSPFCEVDNLILSELAYADLGGIVEPEGEGVLLCDAFARYAAEGRSSGLVNDPAPLFEKAAACRRYGTTRLFCYVDRVERDEQIQFSAVTYLLESGEVYAAFRGTDNTLVGWREDFNFAYLAETPGQAEAARYLDRVAALFPDSPLLVGGHSKGGNFAVYGAVFCSDRTRESIRRVYSNDGPGLHRSVASGEAYRTLAERIEKIIPESSIVGILLSTRERMKVIQSDAKGVWQHNPYAWLVKGTAFLEADERSFSSLFLDETLRSFLDSLSDDECRVLVESLFHSIDASGARSLHELGENKWTAYNAILRAAAGLDPATQKELSEDLKKLARAGGAAFWNEAKKSFEKKEKGLLSSKTEE